MGQWNIATVMATKDEMPWPQHNNCQVDSSFLYRLDWFTSFLFLLGSTSPLLCFTLWYRASIPQTFFFISLPCQHQPMVGRKLWGDCRTGWRNERLSLLFSAWVWVLLLLVVTEGLLWGAGLLGIPMALSTPQQWVVCSYSSHSIS